MATALHRANPPRAPRGAHGSPPGAARRATPWLNPAMHYVPYIAILAAYALIYIPRIGIVGRAMAAQPGGYNNADPRARRAARGGAPRRARAARRGAGGAGGPGGGAGRAAGRRGAGPR